MILIMFSAALMASRRVRFEADPCSVVVRNSNCTAVDDSHWHCPELNPTADGWDCAITVGSIKQDNFTLYGTCQRRSGRPCDVYDIKGYKTAHMTEPFIDQCFYDCGLSVAVIAAIAASASVGGILIVVGAVCYIGHYRDKVKCCRAWPPGDYSNLDRDDVFDGGAFCFPPPTQRSPGTSGFEKPQAE
jgi:hypothetical protein